MRQITAYLHTDPTEAPAVEVDPRPGSYYVSCISGNKRALLYGPLATHAEALAAVERVRAVALEVDRYAVWYAFGTARAELDYSRPGVLNHLIEGGS